MVIIVVGVGATRGWRSTWIGAAAGFVVLAGIVAGLGQALQLIPIGTVRLIIGALLLTFGLQWFRQGVIQTAADGFAGGTQEEQAPGGQSSGAIDWTAFVLAFKGVLLEGLEVAFIVVAFGAGQGGGGLGSGASGGYGAAYIGAAAAFVVIGTLGFVAKEQLQEVPGRTLKFGVGGLLSTFGTFWALEGLGVHWPGGDVSLAWLYALYLSCTFLLRAAVRAELLGPAPPSAVHDPGPAGPSGLAPASAISISDFQSRHGLVADGVVGPQTQAAIRAVRSERGEHVNTARVGVDAADAEAIANLQRRLELDVSGLIDAETRGALRVVQHPGFVDTNNPAALRRFQTEHGFDPTGKLDGETRVAIAAVRSDTSPDRRERSGRRLNLDPIACFLAMDVADAPSVCRFQASVGISATGDVDGETRGAMRAVRATLADESGRGAPVKDRAKPQTVTTEPDPLREDQVRAFQTSHGIAARGVIDRPTREAIRWEREHHALVDPVSETTIRTFQRRHGLKQDGVLGERTRAAIRATRAELEPVDERGREHRYSRGDFSSDRIIDPTDADDLRRFQREHHLKEDASIGPDTRAALRSVRNERDATGRRPRGDDHNQGERA